MAYATFNSAFSSVPEPPATDKSLAPAEPLPGWHLAGTSVPLRTSIVPGSQTPFARLIKLARADAPDAPRPAALLGLPLSGNTRERLKDMAEHLAADHTVYLADFTDAKLVRVDAGDFDLSDNTNYIMDCVGWVRADSGMPPHLFGISQSGIPAFAATVLLCKAGGPLPLSLILIAAPLDVRHKPSAPALYLKQIGAEGAARSPFIGEVSGEFPGHRRRTFSHDHPVHNQARLLSSFTLAPGLMEAFFKPVLKTVHELAGLDGDRHVHERLYLDSVVNTYERNRVLQGDMPHRTKNGAWIRVNPADMEGVPVMVVGSLADPWCHWLQTAAVLEVCRPHLPHYDGLCLEEARHHETYGGEPFRIHVLPALRRFMRAALEKAPKG